MEPEDYEDEGQAGPTVGVRITWADLALDALMPLKGFVDGVSGMCQALAIDLSFHSKAVSEAKEEKRREKLAKSVMSDIHML